jgi:hypothetical protein
MFFKAGSQYLACGMKFVWSWRKIVRAADFCYKTKLIKHFMRPRNLLLGMAFLLPFGILHGQFDSISLARYKLPDIKRKQLDFQFNGSLNHSNEMPNKDLYMNGSGTLSMTYNSFTNRQNYQGNQNVYCSLSPYFYESKQQSYHYRSSSFRSALNFTSRNRFYLQDLFFAEVNISAGLGTNSDDNIRRWYDPGGALTQRNEDESKRLNLNASMPLLVGYGRIEPVEDARLAVYILEDLEKLGRLSRTPNQEEIMELASLISTKKNERVLDSRIKKIEEVKTIDAFLQQKGLINQADGAYFTSLNDNWDYSAGPVRYSGYRVYAGVEPGIIPIFTNSTSLNLDGTLDTIFSSESDMFTRDLQLDGVLGFQYNKPINLSWQFSCGADIHYARENEFYKDRIADSETKSRMAGLRPQQYIQAGFYPNSRTYSTWQLAMDEHWIKDYNWNETAEEWTGQGMDTEIHLNFSWQFYYYISPQLRLSGSYNLQLQRQEYDYEGPGDTHSSLFSNNLSFGVNYSIF